LVSDNGASGEGGPNGSVNENNIFNGVPDTIEENLKLLDELGSTQTYNHYPTGWAWAFNTPFKMWKRYASYEGGIADPLLVSWPSGIDAKSELRSQYTHAIDIVPTLFECLGVELPDSVNGYVQKPFEGLSFKSSLDDASAATEKETQFYSMLGTRGIWHKGWKAATAVPAAPESWGDFDQQRWELFDSEADPSECHDLAETHPEKLQELIALWWAETTKYGALPLESRTAIEILGAERPQLSQPRDRYIYYPGGAALPESVAPNIRNRSYTIAAELEVKTDEATGVIFSQGSRFGGHALYVTDGTLKYVYNWLGVHVQTIEADEPIPTGHVYLSASFDRENNEMPAGGTLSLYIRDEKVGEQAIMTQPGKFGLGGGGLVVGRSGAEQVTDDYVGEAPWPFVGGTIERVVIDVSGEPFADLAQEARAAFARQ
jgi:arylsulfatase